MFFDERKYHIGMIIRQGFSFKLKPDGAQDGKMSRFAGCARWVYNQGLAWNEERRAADSTFHLSYAKLCSELLVWSRECLDFCVQGGFQGGSQSRLSFVYRGLKITDQRLRGTLSRRQKCATRHAEALHHTLHHSIALVKRSPKSRANCGMADDHLLLARVQVSV